MKVQSTKSTKAATPARPPAEAPAKAAAAPKAAPAPVSTDSFQASAALAAAPSDPFASVETFVKAVETTEAGIREARKTLATAEVTRKRVDADTQKPLTEAIAARDAKDAQAVKPLRAAQSTLEATKQQLQAPIDATQAQLGQARADLETATYPDKAKLDAARSGAHAEVSRQEGNVKDAKGKLSRAESDLTSATQSQQQHRTEQTRDIAELDRVRSRQDAARTDLRYAEARLPSQYERDNALRRYDEADRAYRMADDDLGAARRTVQQRQADVDRLAGADRPTPPGGTSNDRPTPPGGSSGSDRPTPPGGSSSAGDLASARAALSDAERAASRAESRRNELRPPLDAARAEVDRHRQLAAEVSRIDGALRSLDQDALALRGRIDGHERSIQSLDDRIAQLKRDRASATDRLGETQRALGAAQSEASRLDATPYAKGEPAKIQQAQAKVDQVQKTLDGHQKTYQTQVGAATKKVEQEQATYDATMTPFRQKVSEAETRRSRELGEAERAEGSAKAELQTLQGQYEKLHDVPTFKSLKWKSPKWLGGEGFNVDDFWKKRQAP